jgi:hypothetical protein
LVFPSFFEKVSFKIKENIRINGYSLTPRNPMCQDIMKTQTIGAALVRKHTVTEAEKKGTEVRIRYFIEFVVSVNSVFGYVCVLHIYGTPIRFIEHFIDTLMQR